MLYLRPTTWSPRIRIILIIISEYRYHAEYCARRSIDVVLCIRDFILFKIYGVIESYLTAERRNGYLTVR